MGCVCEAGYRGGGFGPAAMATVGDQQASCTAVACPPNSIGVSVPAGCVCSAGFDGVITPTSIPWTAATADTVAVEAFYSGSCEAVTATVQVMGTVPAVDLGFPLTDLSTTQKQALSIGLKTFVVKSLVCITLPGSTQSHVVWDPSVPCSPEDAGLLDFVQITNPPALAESVSGGSLGRRRQQSGTSITVEYSVRVPELGVRSYADRAEDVSSAEVPVELNNIQLGGGLPALNLVSTTNLDPPVLDSITWEMYERDIQTTSAVLSGSQPSVDIALTTQLLFLSIGSPGTVTLRTCATNADATTLTLWRPNATSSFQSGVTLAGGFEGPTFTFADFEVNRDITRVQKDARPGIEGTSACPDTNLLSTGRYCCPRNQRAALRAYLEPGRHLIRSTISTAGSCTSCSVQLNAFWEQGITCDPIYGSVVNPFFAYSVQEQKGYGPYFAFVGAMHDTPCAANVCCCWF